MSTPARDVVVSWAAPAMCHSLFASNLGRLLTDPTTSHRISGASYVPSGPQLSAARTAMVDRFLETPLAWLLMLDSDQTFTPQDIGRLFDCADPASVPIVGALYAGTGQHRGWIDMEAGWFDDDHEKGALLVGPATRGVIRVDFVGAGALLVHRSVFERLTVDNPRPQPWFQEVVRNGRVFGSDYEFCRRATAAGFPIHVNADARIGHIKTMVIRPDGITPR